MGNALITRRPQKYASAEPLDPMQVYRQTRPAEWMKMPTPVDNEFYLLFEVPDGYSALLAFGFTTQDNNAQTLVQYGYSDEDRNFVAIATDSVKYPSSITADKYEVEIFADDFAINPVTSDGKRQVLIKLSNPQGVLTFNVQTHQKKTSPADFKNWNIIEIAGKLPVCVNVSVSYLRKLKYFALYGENKLAKCGAMFSGCSALIAVLSLDTSQTVFLASLFANCSSLVAFPKLNTSNNREFSAMFSGCSSLKAIPYMDMSNLAGHSINIFKDCKSLITIPDLDFSNCFYSSGLFQGCHSLQYLPPLDFPNGDHFESCFEDCWSLQSITWKNPPRMLRINAMFKNCYSLKYIDPLDFALVTSSAYIGDLFTGCQSLESITINNYFETSFFGMFKGCASLQSIKVNFKADYYRSNLLTDLTDCSLGRAAIVDIINSFPDPPEGAPLMNFTIVGNPGVNDLTDEDKAVIEAKGFQLITTVEPA